MTRTGLGLVLCAALCWAGGNLVLKGLGGVSMLPVFIWASLVPPVPMLALSWVTEGPDPLATMLALSGLGWLSVIYVALVSTVLGYSLWGALLSRHRAADITPFALLIPVVGIATAALVLGERLSLVEVIGALVIMAGLALSVLGPRWQQR
ncbi:EamA family transporter [Rhodophyticola sp. CCM32]|uniref:EamA family transporter n=1 Tax=Rhodophyticola sp. CCM32 TaxID=2916397 RepID=UPI00143DA169|nr:EamA family transporter [Rhodophyticola sp. CCM32]